MRRTLERHLLAIGVYAATAVILTWPTAAQFATHVPGDGIDNPALAWNLWWIKARLIDQLNLNIFDTDWMFHPIGIDLAFYTLTPLNGLLSIPLQTAFLPIVANNIVLLVSFVLSGYGAFLLALYIQARSPHLTQERPRQALAISARTTTTVALIAGLCFAFASPKLFYAALGQYNIASSQWIPFAALYIVRLGDSHRLHAALRNGALAGLFIAMQAWAELTFASFLLIFFAIYVLWWVFTRLPGGEPQRPTHTAQLPVGAFAAGVSVSAVVFLVGIMPFLAAMLPDLLAEGDFFSSGGGFADVFSADLMGYLVPTRLHPLFGSFTAGLPFPNDKGQHIYLGYTMLLLASAGVYGYGVRGESPKWKDPVWFWLLSAAAFWLLTLGPTLRWAGNELPVPGPFALVSRLPFFSGNRYPSRYGVMVLLAASVLAAYGLRYLVVLASCSWRTAAGSRKALAFVAATFALLLLFEHISVPLLLTDFRAPPIYKEIASDTGDFTVLELPTGWRNGARVLGRSDTLIMMQQWYQTEHGKRRLGGNTSRNPPLKFQYFTEAPLIGELIALMNADRDHIAADLEENYELLAAEIRNLSPGVLEFLGVKYLMVHEERSPAPLLRVVEESLPVSLISIWQGADWTGEPSTIRLYAVNERPPDSGWEIDLAAQEGRLHLAEGWSTLNTGASPYRYAVQPHSALLLDLPSQGGTLELELAGIADEVDLRLNGQRIGTYDVGPAGALAVRVPPDVADDIVDRLNIRWRGGAVPISELGTGPDIDRQIGGTGSVLGADISVAARSAGEEVGDFAHIYVNGLDHAPNSRGYNLVAINPEGEVLDAQAFDTHADPGASAELAAWIDQWPQGTIIAGAVADDASMNLQGAAVDALAKVGVQHDLRGKFRWSHAFIGVVGARGGTALEDMLLIRPAEASVGPPVDAPAATGGVGRIRFRASE